MSKKKSVQVLSKDETKIMTIKEDTKDYGFKPPKVNGKVAEFIDTPNFMMEFYKGLDKKDRKLIKAKRIKKKF